MLQSPFLFITCQVGAEGALKEELARDNPELRFSYSRPGFLTYKASADLSENYELRSVFARAYGLSVKRFKKPAEVLEWVESLGPGPFQRHVWERDQFEPGEEPKGFIPGKWIAPLAGALPNARAGNGDRVIDIVVVGADEFWCGIHLHGPTHSSFPGGRSGITLPVDAPSRAYLKLEEAAVAFDIPFRKGDCAVEIGSAPGGVAYALLQRGLSVVGIDPGLMDPIITQRFGASYRHFSTPVANVPREDLPKSIEWLLLDMNVAPAVSVFAVDRLVTRTQDTLLGVLLTVKLNRWEMASEIPSWLEHVRAMGMVRVRAAQLAANGREICIYGLTRAGAKRV